MILAILWLDRKIQIMQRIELAIQFYLQRLQTNKHNIGAILTGSYVHGHFDRHSDIDIYVILHPDCDFRERGNTWINGVEIEYFKNPPHQIRSYFRTEKSPHTAHMLAKGQVLFNKDPVVSQLIEEAKVIWDTPPPPMNEVQVEFGKYGLDDKTKDLKDALLNQNFLGTQLIRAALINHCIDLFFQFRRIRRYKDKGLQEQLQEYDPDFLQLVKKSFKEKTEPDSIFELVHYTEQLLGGKRTPEWVLKSPVDIKE